MIATPQRPERVIFRIGLAHNPQAIAFASTDDSYAKKQYASQDDPTLIGIVKLSEIALPIVGVVWNEGATNLTLSAQASSDNGQTDAYSGHVINIRAAAATAATLVVVPHGRAVFTIEAITSGLNYLRFNQSPNTLDGLLTIEAFVGRMELRQRQGYP